MGLPLTKKKVLTKRELAYNQLWVLCMSGNFDEASSIKPSVWRFLDNEMMIALQDKLRGFGLEIPPFMFEQARQIATFNAFSRGTASIYNVYDDYRKNGIVPFSQLCRFLYDDKMFEGLKVAKSKDNVDVDKVVLGATFDDDFIFECYGRNHSQMTSFTKKFIKDMKLRKKWSSKTKFHLTDIVDIRTEFFKKLNEDKIKKIKAKIVTVFTQKGGVGKSGICLSLAGALAYTANKNNRVLVIDCDYQMTTTGVLIDRSENGTSPPDSAPSVFSLLRQYEGLKGANSQALADFDEVVANAPLKSTHANIDIIPASEDSGFDRDFKVGVRGGGYIMPDALAKVIAIIQKHHNYDYILIDTRPDLHASAALSYFAADEIISVLRPSGTDYSSFMNFSLQMACSVIPAICGSEDYRAPARSRILVNQFQTSNKNQEKMIGALRGYAKHTSYEVEDIVIPLSTVITTTSSQESTIWNAVGRSGSSIDNKTLSYFRGLFTQLALTI